MKRLLKVLSTVFTVIMLCALVILMCMGWLNISGKAFHVFGYALLRVQTGSMAPTYDEGDFLLSKEADTDLLKKGDVITFFSVDPKIEGMLNTHRIVDIERENGVRVFTTKGDAAEAADNYKVSEDKVFGVTLGSVGFLKWLAKILAIPWIFAAIVFFPLLLMIVSEARVIVRAVKRVKVNKQLMVLGLDPEDTTVSALVEKYGIEIFQNAAREISEEAEENAAKTAAEGECAKEDSGDVSAQDKMDAERTDKNISVNT